MYVFFSFDAKCLSAHFGVGELLKGCVVAAAAVQKKVEMPRYSNVVTCLLYVTQYSHFFAPFDSTFLHNKCNRKNNIWIPKSSDPKDPDRFVVAPIDRVYLLIIQLISTDYAQDFGRKNILAPCLHTHTHTHTHKC